MGTDNKQWLSNKYKEACSKGQKWRATPTPILEDDQKPAALEITFVLPTVLSVSRETSVMDSPLPKKSAAPKLSNKLWLSNEYKEAWSKGQKWHATPTPIPEDD